MGVLFVIIVSIDIFDITASVIIKIVIVADKSRSELLFRGPQERGNAI